MSHDQATHGVMQHWTRAFLEAGGQRSDLTRCEGGGRATLSVPPAQVSHRMAVSRGATIAEAASAKRDACVVRPSPPSAPGGIVPASQLIDAGLPACRARCRSASWK